MWPYKCLFIDVIQTEGKDSVARCIIYYTDACNRHIADAVICYDKAETVLQEWKAQTPAASCP